MRHRATIRWSLPSAPARGAPPRWPACARSGTRGRKTSTARRSSRCCRTTPGRPSSRRTSPHASCSGPAATASRRAANGAPRSTWACRPTLEAEVRHTVDVLRDKGVAHAAVVVLDNPSGDILAWVGSPDFFADTSGQVDMVVSPRQPGSALKPFLYGLAFDRGVTPATVLPDLPRTYQTTLGPYRPRNYDRQFHGPVRARDALGSSYNVPAVELAERIGVSSLLATLHDAGFASLDHSPEYYGLGLVARQRRRHAARAGERVPRAVERGRVETGEVESGGRCSAGRWSDGSGTDGTTDHVAAGGGAGARHPERPGGAAAELRGRDAARPSVSGGRQDRYESPLHRQLGRGDHGRVHGRGMGGQLQRPPDAGRRRHHGRGAAAASRRVARGAALSTGRTPHSGPGRGRSGPDLPPLGAARGTRLSPDDRVVHSRHRAGPLL